MRRSNNHESESAEPLRTPRVVSHFPSIRENAKPNPKLSMFVQDLRSGIMPISGGLRRAPNFAIALRACSAHKTRAIKMLESLDSTYADSRNSTEELLSDSLADLANKLAAGGRTVHEIIRDKRTGAACQLYNFTCRRLFRMPRKYIQVIPKADRGMWNKTNRTYVIVPVEDIWDISMPQVLGGLRGYRKILKKLARFPYPAPSFLVDEVSEQRRNVYYDLERYVREVQLFTTKATAQWGWDQRDYKLQHWTEFYAVYRHIKLKWAQACIREHIVSELNQLFRRLHIEAEIVVTGLPTAQKILKVQHKMCNGDISMNDALNVCGTPTE